MIHSEKIKRIYDIFNANRLLCSFIQGENVLVLYK